MRYLVDTNISEVGWFAVMKVFLRWLSLVDDPLSLASIIDPYILLMHHVRPIVSASQVRSDAVPEMNDVAVGKSPHVQSRRF